MANTIGTTGTRETGSSVFVQTKAQNATIPIPITHWNNVFFSVAFLRIEGIVNSNVTIINHDEAQTVISQFEALFGSIMTSGLATQFRSLVKRWN